MARVVEGRPQDEGQLSLHRHRQIDGPIVHTIHAVLMVCRFAHDAAAMMLWGGFGYLLTCVPQDLARQTTKRLGRLPSVAVAVTVVTAVTFLPIKTAMIGDGWADAVAPGMLWAVISATSVGTAWLADVSMSVLLLLALYLPPPQRGLAVAVCSGLVLSSLVLTGHAMMHEGWIGYLQQANDLVHVLASAAWLGALVPLTIIMRGSAGKKTCQGHHDDALWRFSAAGQVAVVLILLTGVANTLLIVGGWPTNWSSTYQVLLCAKIGIVLVMIALASRNRFLLAPRLVDQRHVAASAIRKAAIAEIALGLAAIALVAIFGLMEPGQPG